MKQIQVLYVVLFLSQKVYGESIWNVGVLEDSLRNAINNLALIDQFLEPEDVYEDVEDDKLNTNNHSTDREDSLVESNMNHRSLDIQTSHLGNKNKDKPPRIFRSTATNSEKYIKPYLIDTLPLPQPLPFHFSSAESLKNVKKIQSYVSIETPKHNKLPEEHFGTQFKPIPVSDTVYVSHVYPSGDSGYMLPLKSSNKVFGYTRSARFLGTFLNN